MTLLLQEQEQQEQVQEQIQEHACTL